MSNRINNAYILKKDEKVLIKNNFFIHNDWEKSTFSTIKSNIKDFLRPEQNNKCCYCKRELGFDIKDVDIEHIISKSTYPEFTFFPLNLALSCPGCNTKKGNYKINSKAIVRYPKNSDNLLIVHAHFDKFNDHIIIHQGFLFEPISKKGSNTITVCELFRLKTVEELAKVAISKKSDENQIIDKLLKSSKEELGAVLIEIRKYIK